MKCSDECCPDKPTRHCENPDRAVWGLKVSTIGRRLAAIAVAHRKAGVPDHELPTRDHRVRAVWKGIRRTTGVAKAKKKGIEVEQHCDLAMSFGTSTSDLRDKALLLLTFFSSCRRSEIVALDIADLAFNEKGVVSHAAPEQDRPGRRRLRSAGALPASRCKQSVSRVGAPRLDRLRADRRRPAVP